MTRSSPAWLLIAFLIAFVGVGFRYWQIPYSQVSLPGSMYGPGLVAVGDQARLRQVVVNLVDNAIRHSPAGARVTVFARQATSSGLRLEVCDEGPGILPKDLPRIFERFYKGDRVRTRRVGGSGLGLAIARHMIEAHGGTLAAASEFGHGSTLTITLPND